jgi:hypothetical protein
MPVLFAVSVLVAPSWKKIRVAEPQALITLLGWAGGQYKD